MLQARTNGQSVNAQSANAIRVTSAVFGAYAGLLGFEHGLFESLQGNHPVPGMRILASNRELPFPFGHEPAMTVIPNFLATGIAAMLTGMLIVLWSAAFLRKTRGAVFLILLSGVLFLVGGGFGPVTLLVAACIAAFRAGGRVTMALPRAPSRIGRLVANAWPWFLLASLAWVPLEFAAGQIFHLKNDHRQILTNLNLLLSYPMLALFVLTLIAASARSRSDTNPRAS